MKTTQIHRTALGLCLAVFLLSATLLAEQVPISEVGSELKGQQAEIVGRIANKIAPVAGDAPYRWYLTDDEGAITVLLAPSVAQQLEELHAGQLITVRGEVQLDRFSPVLQVTSVDQIKLGGDILTAEMRRDRLRARQATPRPLSRARPSRSPPHRRRRLSPRRNVLLSSARPPGRRPRRTGHSSHRRRCFPRR